MAKKKKSKDPSKVEESDASISPSPIISPSQSTPGVPHQESIASMLDLPTFESYVDSVTNTEDTSSGLGGDTHSDAETGPMEEHPQQRIHSLTFESGMNVFDELRELDSTSEWA